MIEVDKTGGKGQFFDQVQNYGYINGQMYRDVNEYKKAGGGGVFDTGSGQSFGNQSGNSFGFNNTAQPSFDPVATYQKLMEGSGIKDTQAQIDTITKLAMEKEAAKNQAVAGVNDNPFYSEATRVGRARKVEESANADIATLTNQAVPLANKIAVAKADIETQLGLETQRYNIRSQEAQQAQQQFQTLLSSGALDNASGEDIANIVRSTGMSSNMIQAAIESTRKKNNPVSFQEYDDGTNQGFAVIDSQGNILSKQVVANSKPKETSITQTKDEKIQGINAKASQYLTSVANSYGDVNPTIWRNALNAYIQDGGDAQVFIKQFASFADTNRGDFENAYGFKNPKPQKK